MAKEIKCFQLEYLSFVGCRDCDFQSATLQQTAGQGCSVSTRRLLSG